MGDAKERSQIYTELFASEKHILFKPHVVMKLVRSQALLVVYQNRGLI